MFEPMEPHIQERRLSPIPGIPFELRQKRARQGDADAQELLGVMYGIGHCFDIANPESGHRE